MPTVVEIMIPGEPVALPRHCYRRGNVAKGEPPVVAYLPRSSEVNTAKEVIRFEARRKYRAAPHDGPVTLKACFVLRRPKAKCWKRKPTPSYPHTVDVPDLDNLLKLLLDSLTGVLWVDDRQVYDVRVSKWVAAGNEAPHTEAAFTLERLEDAA